jgi:hypothetical protein
VATALLLAKGDFTITELSGPPTAAVARTAGPFRPYLAELDFDPSRTPNPRPDELPWCDPRGLAERERRAGVG